MSVAVLPNVVDQKTATSGGAAVVVAADYGEGGFIEDAGATGSTLYELWIRAASSTINAGASGQASDKTKLIQIPASAGDIKIGVFRRSDLEDFYVYGSNVATYVNLSKVIKIL